MDSIKKKDQEVKFRMAASSPTTTVCDTTTAILPLPTAVSGSSTQNSRDLSQEDYNHKLHEYLKHLHHNDGENLRSSVSSVTENSHSPYKHHCRIPPKNHSSTTNNHPFSKSVNVHRAVTGNQSINRKRNSEKAHDPTDGKVRKRSKNSAEHSKHEIDNSPLVDFYNNTLLSNERHCLKFEGENNGSNYDHGDNKEIMDDTDMTSYTTDIMRGIGSKSTVPEEVRLRINSRERQRMHDLNTALDSLRQVMPYSTGPTVKKLSKMSTLLLARNYIVMLTRSLEEMKRLVQELSTNSRPKPVPTTRLLPDPVYLASLLASNHTTMPPTGLYLPPPTVTALPRMPSVHCLSSPTGTPNCACVECQRKNLLAASATFLESKKSP